MNRIFLNWFLGIGILFAAVCIGISLIPRTPPTPVTFYPPKHTATSSFDALSLPDIATVPDTGISLLSVGDIMLDRQVKAKIDTYGEAYLFANLTTSTVRFFDGYDMVSGNMEGPFANTRRTTTKEIAFRFDPTLLPLLKEVGFTIFSAANNHSYDMGRDGFRESVQNLRDAGFLVYGEQYQVNSSSLLIHGIKEKKVAFIGVNDTNAPISVSTTIDLIREAEEKADVTIMNVHWGEEYRALSNDRQRELAHTFIDHGVDVVIGHHPHWVQEMEIYKERPIFYSLGNFVFDQYFSKNTQEGLAVGLTFFQEEIAMNLFPVKSVLSQVYVMPENERTTFFTSFIDSSRFGDYSGSTSTIRIPITSYKE